MKDYLYDEMYRDEANYWWFKARREIILTIIERYSSKNMKILDSGCGCGYILSFLERFGQVYAMDNSSHALEYTKKSFKGDVRKGDLNLELPYEKNFFDMVLSLDVLEHIEQDEVAIKNIGSILKENGVFLCTVPAHQFLWSYHDINHMHKRRYSKKEIVDKLQRGGFLVEYVSYYNMWLYLPVVLVRFLKKIFLRDKNNVSDGKMPSSFVNILLYKIFKSETHLIRKSKKLPFGVSLIIIARKK